jgi:crotonobetainyl-CoA:carnitine CoA-transferase CaiB-like acyl-CoA transferase
MPEPVSHADIAAGMAAAHGVLAALFRRERTGEGAFIDASMCEAMMAANEWTEVEANGGPDYELSPFRPGKAAVVQLGDADGTWVALPGSPAAIMPRCAKLWGRPELLEEPRFATMQARASRLEECLEVISAYAQTFDSFEAFESTLSNGARLPVGRLISMTEAIEESDWSVDRRAFVDVPAGDDDTVRVHRSALRIRGVDCGPRGGVKQVGADNRTVLAEVLDLDEATIDRLHADGAIVGGH